MLSPGLEGRRLSLHVIAATLWVGGQFTLAGLVPTLRPYGAEVTTAVARRFAQIAWPAFAVLVLTGFWNIAAVHPSNQDTGWEVVFGVKMGVVVVSGVTAFMHQRSTSRTALAVYGSLSGVSAALALVPGVFLAG